MHLLARVAMSAAIIEHAVPEVDSMRDKAQKPRVKAVCRSDWCADPKVDVGSAELRAGWGLVGDSHAGPARPGRWQISLLAWESVERLVREVGLRAVPGSFAENLSIVGLNTTCLQIGDWIKIGDEVLLEVEQLGKPPEIAHTFSHQGYSLLPTEGIFCGVIAGGTVNAGDEIQVVGHSPQHSNHQLP